MMRFLSSRWFQTAILLLMLSGIVTVRVAEPSLVIRLRHLTFDFYNRLMPRTATDTVAVIDIDEASLQKFGQWPWSRPLIGRLVQKLDAMGAKAVAFDMVFSEPDRTSPDEVVKNLPDTPEMKNIREKLLSLPDNDSVFADMIRQAGNVTLGFVAANEKTQRAPISKTKWDYTNWKNSPNIRAAMVAMPDFATNLPVIQEAAAGSGSFTATPETDGVIRKVALVISQWSRTENAYAGQYPTLALEAIRVALKEDTIRIYNSRGTPDKPVISAIKVGDHVIPTESDGKAWVYFSGYDRARYIPAWKILEDGIEKKRIRDKVVFVGASAIGLRDLRSTPLGDTDSAGVDVHRELTEQILSGQYLSRPYYFDGMEILSMAGLCLLMIFALPFVGALTMALLGIFLIWGGILGSLYAYNTMGFLIDPVYPSLAIIVMYIVTSILMNLRTEVEKRAVRHAFAHYISPAFMEELAKNPESLRLGGQTRELTVMFTDIRGFTSIAEAMEPGELITLINDFLTPMSSQVMDTRGTIDKYMGDAMMAFWNAPLLDEDHARHACMAALGMARALEPVNAALEQRAKEKNKTFSPLRAGIGLNTGSCAVGNMGSRQRFAYSAIGDAVNLASRLEGQTKFYGVPIIVSESTRRLAPEFAAIELDLIKVKGKNEPVRIFALIGDAVIAENEAFRAFDAAHSHMLSLYRGQDFKAALDALGSLLNTPRAFGVFDTLYGLYRQRLEALAATPPQDPHWNGVFVATDK